MFPKAKKHIKIKAGSCRGAAVGAAFGSSPCGVVILRAGGCLPSAWTWEQPPLLFAIVFTLESVFASAPSTRSWQLQLSHSITPSLALWPGRNNPLNDIKKKKKVKMAQAVTPNRDDRSALGSKI